MEPPRKESQPGEKQPFVISKPEDIKELEEFGRLNPLQRIFLVRYTEMRIRSEKLQREAVSPDYQPSWTNNGLLRTDLVVETVKIRNALIGGGVPKSLIQQIDQAKIEIHPPRVS